MTPEEIQQARELAQEVGSALGPDPAFLARAVLALTEPPALPEGFFVGEDAYDEVYLWSGRPDDNGCKPLVSKRGLDGEHPALWPALLRGLAVVDGGEGKPVGLHTRVAVGVLSLLTEWMADEGLDELPLGLLESAQVAAIDERGGTAKRQLEPVSRKELVEAVRVLWESLPDEWDSPGSYYQAIAERLDDRFVIARKVARPTTPRRVKCSCGQTFATVADFADHGIERTDAGDHEHEEVYQP